MIRFGCFAYSKIGGIRAMLLPNRKFCVKISGKYSFDSTINEIKQSINKLESEIEQQNKLRNRQREQKLEEMLANFDELQKNHRQFEHKFVSLVKDIKEGNKEMKEAFDKFACNLQIMRKNEHQETGPRMEEAKVANSIEEIDGNVYFIGMKSNKWDCGNCGPKLTISDGGLEVKHSGKYDDDEMEINCVRAELPLPKLNVDGKLIFYFEVEIVEKHPECDCAIGIGFCDKQFPLEGSELGIGMKESSIGIFDKGRMLIGEQWKWIESREDDDGDFYAGDVVGVGIIHSTGNSQKMRCFASCNGKLLGMAELPEKFAEIQLFPAISFWAFGDSVRANFGKAKWRFNPSQLA